MAKEIVEQFKLDFGPEFEDNDELDTKYTTKIKAAQYEPTMPSPPDIFMLVSTLKTNQLIDEIDKSNVTDKEKKFLKLAAQRHLSFNYQLIAEYYAHATPEMQRLMEKSALVIIDIGDAIANGYVKLSTNIENIVKTNRKNEEEQAEQEEIIEQAEDLDLEDMLNDL